VFIPALLGLSLIIVGGCSKQDYSDSNGPQSAHPASSANAPTATLKKKSYLPMPVSAATPFNSQQAH